MTQTPAKLLLTLSCRDQIGIVADVSRFFVQHDCNIVESAQFEDPVSGSFFMRTAVESARSPSLEALRSAFLPIAERFRMNWQLTDKSSRMRTLIMVSRLGHCLNDLLFRYRTDQLPVDLRLIVSNHNDFADLVRQNGTPFQLMEITPETRAAQEAALIQRIESEQIELIVLARYMQILSDGFCARYPGRIINIHHSLLPSFKGARPYHRAYERGVKLIGATAHYVTAELDEGPIIEQDVQRVRHNFAADDLVAIGRQIETVVLANAVQWHAQRRVLLNGSRTVVFH